MVQGILNLAIVIGLLLHPHIGCAACHDAPFGMTFDQDVAVGDDHDHGHDHDGDHRPDAPDSGGKCAYLSRATGTDDSQQAIGLVSLHGISTDATELLDCFGPRLAANRFEREARPPSAQCAQHQILLL